MNALPKETWIAPPTTPKIYSAIAKVMAEIGRTGISKERNNQQQGFKFRGIDDVYNAMSPLLAGAGICILPRVTRRDVTERQTKSGGVLFYVALDVDYDLCCAEDGSKHSISVSGEAMDSGDKATNKAMSAAFKYACMQVFCIPTEGNPDADSETHEPIASAAPQERHEPMQSDLSHVSPEKVQEASQHMIKLMSQEVIGDHDDEKRAAICLDYHEKVLNPDQDLYQAAGKALPVAKRNTWHALVRLAKRLEKEDRVTDPNSHPSYRKF